MTEQVQNLAADLAADMSMQRARTKGRMAAETPEAAKAVDRLLRNSSTPVLRAARHYGVSLDVAYLLADLTRCMVAARVPALGRWSAWPQGHPQHAWAISEAKATHDEVVISCFVEALVRHFNGIAFQTLAKKGQLNGR
jgi:hypothetical protein